MPRHFSSRRIAQLVDVQFIRFVLVGCLNTAVGYGLFAAFILVGLPSALALLIATVIGVLFNYFSTGRLVFAWRTSSRLWLFVLSYVVIYVVNAAALLGLERMSVSALLAQAVLLPAMVGLAFLLNKYFVFSSPRTVRS
jgi:putative flippase GtrA